MEKNEVDYFKIGFIGFQRPICSWSFGLDKTEKLIYWRDALGMFIMYPKTPTANYDGEGKHTPTVEDSSYIISIKRQFGTQGTCVLSLPRGNTIPNQ